VSSPTRALHFGQPKPTAFAAPPGPAQLPRPALGASSARDGPCASPPRDIGHRRIRPCRSRLGLAIPVALASPAPLTAGFGFAARTSRPRPRLGRARAAVRAQQPRPRPRWFVRCCLDRARAGVPASTGPAPLSTCRRAAIRARGSRERREREGGEGRRTAIRARGVKWRERREGRERRAAAPPSARGEVSGGRDGARRSALLT